MLAAVFLLAGCSATPDSIAVRTPDATDPPPPTFTIDPGPVALSVEEAAERYLRIVCPTNAASVALSAAFAASGKEFLGGGAPDPAAVKRAAQASLTRETENASLFDDPYYVWPDEVEDQILIVRDSSVQSLRALSMVVNAGTYEAAYYVAWPDESAAAGASQAIRYQLGIGADTTATCVDYADGHEVLLAEREDREAKLAEQEF